MQAELITIKIFTPVGTVKIEIPPDANIEQLENDLRAKYGTFIQI